jgi:hypothetical protein
MLRLGVFLLLASSIFCQIDYFGKGTLTVSFTSDPTIAQFSLTAQKGFYYGFGLGDSMTNSDMHIITVTPDGQFQLADMFSTGRKAPTPDVQLGGNGVESLFDVKFQDQGDRFTVQYKRKLVTGDDFDVPLTATGNKYINAMGPISQPGQIQRHDKASRGFGTFNIQPASGNLRVLF